MEAGSRDAVIRLQTLQNLRIPVVRNIAGLTRKTVAQWHEIRARYEEEEFTGPSAELLGYTPDNLLTAHQYHSAMVLAGLHSPNGRTEEPCQ